MPKNGHGLVVIWTCFLCLLWGSQSYNLDYVWGAPWGIFALTQWGWWRVWIGNANRGPWETTEPRLARAGGWQPAICQHLYPHPACTRSALAHIGFPLCPEGPGARTCKARQLLRGCNPSLPQEWVCPQAEAAAAYPQTQQDLLWVTSTPKMVWLNQLFQCTSHISALSLTSLMVSAQAFIVVLRKSPEEGLNSSRGCTMVKHIGKGWPSPNPLLQCTMEVTWGGKRCRQGRI